MEVSSHVEARVALSSHRPEQGSSRIPRTSRGIISLVRTGGKKHPAEKVKVGRPRYAWGKLQPD